jgi:selenocysteine lyase/cysteine desulfurase
VGDHRNQALLEVVGAGKLVPVVPDGSRRYVNLDWAASAPALTVVADAVAAFLPWYSSVHRGAGFASVVSTEAYEAARHTVAGFVVARADDVVIFTRNTTDSMNLMASALPPGGRVLAFESEHHANLLPWRNAGEYLPIPGSPDEALASLRAALAAPGARATETTLVAVTGASNVTGELWPVADIVAIAHEYGARVVVDAAQLAPHRAIDMTALDVDYLAFSGHKLYAPYGAGVLVGRRDWLAVAPPYLAGGGAVQFVTTEEVLWSEPPERHEAGSPNVVGAVALAAACRELQRVGMAAVAEHERALLARARDALADVPGLAAYGLWDDNAERIGVLTFNVEGIDHALLAAALSAEHAVGVRHGCFCAHPLMLRLLAVGAACAEEIRTGMRQGENLHIPGAVRMSVGAGASADDIDALAAALHAIAARGPQWHYEMSSTGDEYLPVPDPRPRPLAVSLNATGGDRRAS